jgi:hypothetical protein
MPGNHDDHSSNDDIAAHNLLWQQAQSVHVLQELYDLEGDEPSKYFLDCEKKIEDMIEHDLACINPVEWVHDMVKRTRFGMNIKKQEAYVGGKVHHGNMYKVLEHIYDGVSKKHQGGVTRVFQYRDIDPTLMACVRYKYQQYAADLPQPKKADYSHAILQSY